MSGICTSPRALIERFARILFCALLTYSATSAFAIAIGDRVQTTAGVNVRPSPGGTPPGTQSAGSQGYVTSGPVTAVLSGTSDSYTWWQVDFDTGSDGWVAVGGLSVILPAAPVPSSPTGSQVVSSLTPTLQWSGGSGYRSLQVNVSKSPFGSANIIYTSGWLPAGSTSIAASNLNPATNYRWDVTACPSANGAGTCVTGSNALFSTQSPGDTAAPTINAFSLGSSSISLGAGVGINISVSDSGGSGLNRVEVNRTNGDGSAFDPNWALVQTINVNGNGPVGFSAADTPPATGRWWYGIRVYDNQGNRTDERASGLGPLSVAVQSVPTDSTPPSISSFAMDPTQVTLGNGVTLSVTVADSGGSGLARVEMNRTNGDGSANDPNWVMLASWDLSGNGPVPITAGDVPPSAGTWWYGVRVYDKAGNRMDERGAGRGPLRVAVVQAVPAPSCTISPTSANIASGTTKSFAGSCTNSPTQYVWRVDGSQVATGTSSTYTTSSNLAAGTHTVSVTAGNAGGTSNNASASLVVGAATYSVSGTITKSTGGVMPGVVVSAGTQASAVTDSSGNFAIGGLPAGGYSITPAIDGYVFTPPTRTINLTSAGASGVNFTGSASYSIAGFVRLNGAGLPGVTLSTGSVSATSRSDGSYSLAGLLSGNYTVTASLQGYSFTPASVPVTIRTAGATGKDFTAQALYNISGSVRLGDGSPVAGAAVSAGGKSGSTDASGTYTIAGLPNASYTVTPALSGYTFTPASAPATINGKSVGNLNFTAAVATVNGFLGFPLKGLGPYSSQIIRTIIDHQMKPAPYLNDGTIVAFTGETFLSDASHPNVKNGCYSRSPAGSTWSPLLLHLYVGTLDGCTAGAAMNYDGHTGYDYAADFGTTVVAAADGYVVDNTAVVIPGENNVLCVPKGITNVGCEGFGAVAIDHKNGYVTQYLHLSSITVRKGTFVRAGQSIGKSGFTGLGERRRSHLHFEVLRRKVGAPTDPKLDYHQDWFAFVDPYGFDSSGGAGDSLPNDDSGRRNICLWKDGCRYTWP